MSSKTVLLIGASSIWFREPGGVPMSDLIEQELRRRTGDEGWRSEIERLFVAPNMAVRALASIERTKPAAIVLLLGTYQFLNAYSVGVRVRQRWPLLHALANGAVMPLVRPLRRFSWANKAAERARRLPHLLGRRLIGTDASMPPEQAIVLVRETIDVFESSGIPWACGLSSMASTAASSERRDQILSYKIEQAEYLQARDIAFYDIEVRAAAAGHKLQVAPDQRHLQRTSRQFEAEIIAELLLGEINQASRQASAATQ